MSLVSLYIWENNVYISMHIWKSEVQGEVIYSFVYTWIIQCKVKRWMKCKKKKNYKQKYGLNVLKIWIRKS